MPFCRNCGTEVEENDRFCPACGADQGTPDPIYTQYTQILGVRRPWLLIWSILNMLFLVLPAGIVALVYTLRAEEAVTLAEEKRKIAVAKRINIVSSAAMAVLVILYFVLSVQLPLFLS